MEKTSAFMSVMTETITMVMDAPQTASLKSDLNVKMMLMERPFVLTLYYQVQK